MIPINDLINGWVNKFKYAFKLNKDPTDLKNEEFNNQSENIIVNNLRFDLKKDVNNTNITNSKNNLSKIIPLSEINYSENREQNNSKYVKYHKSPNNN